MNDSNTDMQTEAHIHTAYDAFSSKVYTYAVGTEQAASMPSA